MHETARQLYGYIAFLALAAEAMKLKASLFVGNQHRAVCEDRV